MISGERDEEAAAGTDLVPAPDGGLTEPQVADIRAHLPVLIDSGDTETLDEIALRAEAVSRYQARQGHKREADLAVRLKIECEAAIGVVDLRIAPWRSGVKRASEPLSIGGRTVSNGVRMKWRKLGIAHRRDLLTAAIAEIETDPDRELTTNSVYLALTERGVGFTDQKFIVAAMRRASIEQGISLKEIKERAQVAIATADRRRRVVSIEAAWRIAMVIGLDPATLKPANPRKRGGHRRRRLRSKRVSVKGEWSRASQLIRLVQEQVDQLDGASGNAELWAALHIAEDLIIARSRGRRSLSGSQKEQIRMSLCAVVGSPSCAVLAKTNGIAAP